MKNWPHWFPGLELKVEHLVGLEDYLLARVGMTDRLGHGLEQLDWTRSVALLRGEQGGFEVEVRGPLKGITPAGQPVELGFEDLLRSEALGTADPWDRALHVSVEVRPEDTSSRLALKVGFPDGPKENSTVKSNELDLGDYRFLVAGSKELCRRPILRRLDAIRPFDESWREWTRPFSGGLREVLTKLGHTSSTRNLSTELAISALSEIAFDWPTMPIQTLARQLKYTSWLISQSAEPIPVRDIPRPSEPFPPDEASAEDLPRLLARLLPRIPDNGQRLTTLLDELLAPIYLRAPTARFLRWEKHLTAPNPSASFEQIAPVLRHRLTLGEIDGWSRAVALLTIAALNRFGQQEWPTDVLQGFQHRARGPLNGEVVNVLQRLYWEEAQTAPAGPLGFYCLLRVVLTLQGVHASFNKELRTYLNELSAGSSSLAGSSNGGDDRVLRYLRMRNAEGKLHGYAKESLKLLRASEPSRTTRGRLPEFRILVLGPKGSGKSSLLREYTKLLVGAGTGFQKAESASFEYGHENYVDCQARELRFRFRLTEASREAVTNPGSLRGDQFSEIEPWNVVVITIDPAVLDVNPVYRPKEAMLALYKAVAELGLATPALVLIAYTKADEYGVINPDSTRILRDEAQRALLKTIADAEPDSMTWNRFAAEISSAGPDEKWNETRSIVLDQTRDLWIALARRERTNGSRANGYFVSAAPEGVAVQQGLAESLNDIVDFVVTTLG